MSDPDAHAADQISAYIDGEMSGTDLAVFEQHIANCSVCASVLDRTQKVVQAAHELPAGIAPPSDLWPAIQASTKPRRREWMRWAVAAILVVGVGVGLWRGLQSPKGPVVTASEGTEDERVADPGRAAMLAEVERMEADYLEAFAQLKQSLMEAEDVPPDALETIAENLRIIDGAIEMTRVALHKDPGNRKLMRLLVSVYKAKKQTIERAKLPVRS